MWGQAYAQSNDAIVSYVISLCCAMHQVDLIDVIVSCMIPCINLIFLNVLNRGFVRMASYVCK